MADVTTLMQRICFIAPPITVYQTDELRKILHGSLTYVATVDAVGLNELRQFIRGLDKYDLGWINLVQASFVLEIATSEAYQKFDDRLLDWLQKLNAAAGRALTSISSAELASDSAAVHRIDGRHAENRNLIELYRLRIAVRGSIKSMGLQLTPMLQSRIDQLDFCHESLEPLQLESYSVQEYVLHVARQMIGN